MHSTWENIVIGLITLSITTGVVGYMKPDLKKETVIIDMILVIPIAIIEFYLGNYVTGCIFLLIVLLYSFLHFKYPHI